MRLGDHVRLLKGRRTVVSGGEARLGPTRGRRVRKAGWGLDAPPERRALDEGDWVIWGAEKHSGKECGDTPRLN